MRCIQALNAEIQKCRSELRFLGATDNFPQSTDTWNFDDVIFDGQSPRTCSESKNWFQKISGLEMKYDTKCPVFVEITKNIHSFLEMVLRFPDKSSWNAVDLDEENAAMLGKMHNESPQITLTVHVNTASVSVLAVSFKGKVSHDDPHSYGEIRDVTIQVTFQKQ